MSISLSLKLRIILPFALGYFLSYLFRVINTILAPDLAADIGVDPAELGLLTGSYFITFAAMIIGYSVVGALVVRFNRIGIQPLTVAIFGMGLFVLNFLLIILQFETLSILLWISFGFLGTCGILVYAVLPLHFPSHLAGRVITGINLMIFIFSFINQWGIGAVINLWPATAAGGYAPRGYLFAFGMLFVFQLLAFVWFWLSGKVFKKNAL